MDKENEANVATSEVESSAEHSISINLVGKKKIFQGKMSAVETTQIKHQI